MSGIVWYRVVPACGEQSAPGALQRHSSPWCRTFRSTSAWCDSVWRHFRRPSFNQNALQVTKIVCLGGGRGWGRGVWIWGLLFACIHARSTCNHMVTGWWSCGLCLAGSMVFGIQSAGCNILNNILKTVRGGWCSRCMDYTEHCHALTLHDDRVTTFRKWKNHYRNIADEFHKQLTAKVQPACTD